MDASDVFMVVVKFVALAGVSSFMVAIAISIYRLCFEAGQQLRRQAQAVESLRDEIERDMAKLREVKTDTNEKATKILEVLTADKGFETVAGFPPSKVNADARDKMNQITKEQDDKETADTPWVVCDAFHTRSHPEARKSREGIPTVVLCDECRPRIRGRVNSNPARCIRCGTTCKKSGALFCGGCWKAVPFNKVPAWVALSQLD